MVAPVYANFVPPAIDAGNLNEINTVIYDLLGDGTNPPTNDSDIRTNIGLGTIATQDANNVAITGGSITGGSISGITDLAIADGGTGASTAADARTNLNVAQIGPTFSAWRNGSQAILDNTQTEVVFNTELWDTDSAYNTANGRFTPQVAGYYQVSSGVTMSGIGVNNKQIAIYKNGATYKRGSIEASTARDQTTAETISGVVFLNGTTDYVSIFVFIDVTASPNILGAGQQETWFDAIFIRP